MSRARIFAGLPPFRRGAFALFLTTVLCTAILGDQPVARMLALTPEAVLSGVAVWQPITANFIFREGYAGGLLFSLGVQWFLAGDLERAWGTTRYCLFVVGCGIAAYLVSVGLAAVFPIAARTPVAGMTPIDLATVTAFGATLGRQPMQLFGAISMTARTLALLAIGLSWLTPLARGAPWPEVVPLIAAVVLAALFTLRPWSKMQGARRRRRFRRSKRDHLQVVRPRKDLLN